jgi:hypothetical protein
LCRPFVSIRADNREMLNGKTLRLAAQDVSVSLNTGVNNQIDSNTYLVLGLSGLAPCSCGQAAINLACTAHCTHDDDDE